MNELQKKNNLDYYNTAGLYYYYIDVNVLIFYVICWEVKSWLHNSSLIMNAQIIVIVKLLNPYLKNNQVSTLENIYWADMSVYYTKILKLK